MKRFRLFTVILLILGLALFFVLKYKNSPFLQQQPKIDINAKLELTGILREMDLDEELKTNRFITEGKFQLTQLNTDDVKKLPYGATSLFIESYPSNLTEDLLGKCVTIKGNLDTNWISKIDKTFEQDKFIYSELVFLVGGIEKNDYSKCDGYTTDVGIPVDSKPVTLTGTVQRFSRLVPDVGPYDYVFVFTEPYTVVNNASGEPRVQDTMPIVPQNNDVWVKLENKVGKVTVIEAHELWGYVESKYLLVTRVMD